jgi:hypothetical protein
MSDNYDLSLYRTMLNGIQLYSSTSALKTNKTMQFRSTGHQYLLPICKYDLCKESFANRRL